MRRHAENGTCAICHEYEVGDIDWQGYALGERMDRLQLRAITHLLGRLEVGFGGADAVALGDEIGQC